MDSLPVCLSVCLPVQRLSLPTLSVTSETFVPLLTKLDECVSFMQDHVSASLPPTAKLGSNELCLLSQNLTS